MSVELITSVASLIGGRGFGTVGEDIFTVIMPESPKNCIAIIPTGGSRRGHTPNVNTAFQIICRNESPRNGLTIINSLHSVFNNAWGEIYTGLLGRFTNESEPGSFIVDSNNHFLYNINVTFQSAKNYS